MGPTFRKIHTIGHKIRTFGENPKFTHSHSFSPSKLDCRPTGLIDRALGPRPEPPLGPAPSRPPLRALVGWDSVNPLFPFPSPRCIRDATREWPKYSRAAANTAYPSNTPPSRAPVKHRGARRAAKQIRMSSLR